MFKARNARIGNQEVKPGGANVQVDFRRFFHVGKLDLDGQGLVGARQRVRRRARHFFAKGSAFPTRPLRMPMGRPCLLHVLKWRAANTPTEGGWGRGGCFC